LCIIKYTIKLQRCLMVVVFRQKKIRNSIQNADFFIDQNSYHMFDLFIKKIILLVKLIVLVCVCVLTWCSTASPDKLLTNNDQPKNEIAEPIENTVIHALWDSLTAGYQLPIQESYPAQLEQVLLQEWYNVAIVNWWISWDTSEWLLNRLDRQLETAQKNDIAILVIWANDGLRGMPISQMKENISLITEMILEKDLFLIIWGMKIPLNNAPEYRANFEQVYVDLCETYKRNDKVSCIPFFLEWVWGMSELNLPDGIHPTKQWYSIIVENLLPYVKNIVNKF